LVTNSLILFSVFLSRQERATHAQHTEEEQKNNEHNIHVHILAQRHQAGQIHGLMLK
jgi:hypothetical protein